MRIKAMGLSNVKKVYKPVLHGVGWPGDVKTIALKQDKEVGVQTSNELERGSKNNGKNTS
jgi:hypothetical protein